MDQWSKKIFATGGWYRSWGKLLRIGCVEHRSRIYENGAARLFLVLLWLLAAASGSFLYRSGAVFQSRVALIGLGAALGGAAGNLTDILRLRAVLNFVHLGWWPGFNLADVSILGGLTLAFCKA